MSLIIEFAGMPGSGKTTSSACFMEGLRQSGWNVYGRSELRQFVKELGRMERMWLYTTATCSKAFVVAGYMILLARYRVLTYDAVRRFVRLCVFDVALKMFLKSKRPDCMILDQWAIQDLWSATLFKNVAVHKLPHQLKRFFCKTDALFFFEIDATTASLRIENRYTGLSRFDTMAAAERLQALEQSWDYLFLLYQASACPHKYVLSSARQPAENMPLFLHRMRNILPAREQQPSLAVVS